MKDHGEAVIQNYSNPWWVIAINESGATMVEYAIMLVSIAAVCIAIVGILGSETNELFQAVRWW